MFANQVCDRKEQIGANWTLKLCRYLVILDDDVFFTSATRLEVLLDTLEADPHVHVAAGSYTQYDSHKGLAEVNDYSLLFEATGESGQWRAHQPLPPPAGECHRVHASHNFFMARTKTLRRYPWHPKLSIFEHEHFFFQLFLAKQVSRHEREAAPHFCHRTDYYRHVQEKVWASAFLCCMRACADGQSFEVG